MRAFLLFLALSGTPVALILLWLWVDERLAARKPKPAPAAPVVGLTDAEWAELTALQDGARAEFDHAADFDMWTKEMTS